jgi:hypothetical protein
MIMIPFEANFTIYVSNNKVSLWVGRSIIVGFERRLPHLERLGSAISNLTLRTRWSLSVIVSTTLSRRHCPLIKLSSLRMTMSLTEILCSSLRHFCLAWRLNRYSFLHLDQNSLAKYWTLRHRFLAYTSSVTKLPGGGRIILDFMFKRWLGVSGSGGNFKSFGIFLVTIWWVKFSSSEVHCVLPTMLHPNSVRSANGSSHFPRMT